MSLAGCIAAIRAASKGTLSEAEARALLQRMEARHAELAADGTVPGLDERLRGLAAEEGAEEAMRAALAKKHAALQAVTYNRAVAEIRGHVAAGLNHRKAVLAFLEGSHRAAPGTRASVAATALGYQGRYLHEAVDARITRERPDLMDRRVLMDSALADDVVREMRVAGSTANKDAAYLARVYADAAELSRGDLNALGAPVGRLDGWSPQAHAMDKVAAVEAREWIAFTAARLDLERSFPNMLNEERLRILGSIYETIVTGIDPARAPFESSGLKGPANLANAAARARVLHFRDADAWLEYRARFSDGHVHDAMVAHLRHAGHLAAQLERLGPNPEANMLRIIETLAQDVRDNTALPWDVRRARADALEKWRAASIGSAWGEVSGLIAVPVSVRAARIGSAVRAVQSMAKLTGALLSSFTDLPVRAQALRWQGKGWLSSTAESIAELMQGIGRGQQREIAVMLGGGADGMRDHIVSAWHANDSAPGMLRNLTTTMFRLQGLTWWTDAMKAGSARALSRWMGHNRGLAFDALTPEYRRVLSMQGIDAGAWDAIRSTAWRGEDGNFYVTPDRLAGLDDTAIAGLAAERIAALGENADPARVARILAERRRELSVTLHRFFADEMRSAVIEPDAASRRATLWGTRPGTVTGELMRAIAQFKSFPVAFSQRVLGREVMGRSNEPALARILNTSSSLGALIATLTVTGYVGMSAKDLVRGYGPRDPLAYKTILAALAQGGGGGIYGDFLFGEASRFRTSMLETFAGPALSTTAQIANLWARARDGDAKAGEALNIVLQNTPFINLWYARPVLDFLVLNAARESLSPGYLRRQAAGRARDYGQHRILPTMLAR